MHSNVFLILFGSCFWLRTEAQPSHVMTEEMTAASEFWDRENQKLSDMCWGRQSNQTDELTVDSFSWRDFPEGDLKRKFRYLYSTVKQLQYKNNTQSIRNMLMIYRKTKIPKYSKEGLSNHFLVLPEVRREIASTTDADKLLYYWKEWRDVVGKGIRPFFESFIQTNNELAKQLGYSNGGEKRTALEYEIPNFDQAITRLYEQILPFYKHLHSYVRRKLREVYGEKIPPRGPIPSHLLGDLSAEYWGNIESLVKPFPDKPSLQIGERLKDNNWSVMDMVKMVDDLYKSLSFPSLDQKFWENTLLESDPERNITCDYAYFYPGCDGERIRIKICAEVDSYSYFKVIYLIAMYHYAKAVAVQPLLFQDSPNPNIYEASGLFLGLSASTTSFLQINNLTDNTSDDNERDLNFLMYTALRTVPNLIDGLATGKWRLDAFGKISLNQLNEKFWEYRFQYEGLCAPVVRSEEDLDATEILQIASSWFYVNKFFGGIMQFQFHKGLCQIAGHEGPLHRCNLWGSLSAGNKFRDMLKLGKSVMWPEALSLVTGGTTDMDAGPLLEYFQPLYDWLQQQNNNDDLGWDSFASTVCP